VPGHKQLQHFYWGDQKTEGTLWVSVSLLWHATTQAFVNAGAKWMPPIWNPCDKCHNLVVTYLQSN